MRIVVYGLGYVGAVTAQLLADRGHSVLGLDADPAKISRLRAGHAPVPEPLPPPTYAYALTPEGSGLLLPGATAGVPPEVAVLCLPTPSSSNGRLNCDLVRAVALEAAQLKTVQAIVVRSTVMPGTCAKLTTELGIPVYHWPELTREGTAWVDANSPSLVMWGEPKDCLPGNELFFALAGPRSDGWRWTPEHEQVELGHTTEIEIAKLAANAWRATKVSFANEIGMLSRSLGADGRRVMAAVMSDSVLSTSALYTRPGGPWGGSCLPKDVRALTALQEQSSTLLSAVIGVNRSVRARITNAVMQTTKNSGSVVIVGMSFKEGTADLRDSAAISIGRSLFSHVVNFIDSDVPVPQKLSGFKDLQPISASYSAGGGPASCYVFMKKNQEVVNNILAARAAGYRPAVIDCVGLEEPERFGAEYRGIHW